MTFEQGSTYVQVVSANKVRKQAIRIGLISEDLIEVKEGLHDGDLVVTRAGTFLRDGDVVRPVMPEAKLSEAR